MLHVGYCTGIYQDPHRLAWDGKSRRPLAWSAWYPTTGRGSGDVPDQIFELGTLAVDAEPGEGPHPVVLMSHGTGGSPESLGWLARVLAQAGYLVIGAHHHGNTGREPYLPEGFLCWWERGADLSELLTHLSASGPFAGRLDLTRVHALGFSLGAYTVLSLAGARTSIERYKAWAGQSRFATGPREFPDAAQQVTPTEAFKLSWARRGDDFTDGRIRSCLAIAPPPPVRAFDPETLNAITQSVVLITGEADTEAPSAECAAWLAKTNPAFQWKSAGAHVGHYTFLGLPMGKVPEDAAFLFNDHPGVDRRKVHQATAQLVLDAIS